MNLLKEFRANLINITYIHEGKMYNYVELYCVIQSKGGF
ncbi:hypothetical protein Desor_5348 [Desulfosporosinus orientis DSM 765]|uniref:Uncharacterized protein n=1 Tax=Desulfosporosinus orientis (strain ATCC 19365 / DSM 765 / NCIMB 8382 / VKM B-1628 / Singapore I) TaxID=768706 RepID=G7WCA8_DESOD|nr:hypothetical protein Desor_5348 [Desulfosporosinus orientis DSM 765]